ncbi:hypothetical protein [Sanyastnella coralliicola]|uniref:hypothetical protein n=1 Tax=Sanyastnella coralliicola TaxID=3069118 RepID=UPI0027B9770E|nr:hypothetical protein [Longitalea sp. SCSIO 12813]
MNELIMMLGFALAAYSVVGNDSIQTLGTFLVSNERRKWWQLWLFAGGLMAIVVTMGYLGYGELLGGKGADLTFGKFDGVFKDGTEFPEMSFWYLLPPLALLFITRFGVPVSTTFLVLTFFAPKALPSMLTKSLGGYGVAFIFAIIMFMLLSRVTERLFLKHPFDGEDKGLWTNRKFWIALQWASTGFLWSQWLTQDLVNIMVYLGDPDDVSIGTFIYALGILLVMLAYIFYRRGGKIQEIVRAKTNTQDIRSATFIDFFYGLVLLLFKFDTLGIGAQIPMSTTWVFLGMLAGREVAMRIRLEEVAKDGKKVWGMVFADLGKATIGLVVSVLLVVFLYVVEGRDLAPLLD